MWNALVVVWRESLEALLVIGVMWSWTATRSDQRRLRVGLWMGVAIGALVALVLGYATYAAQGMLAQQTLEQVHALMPLLAALLILHMVLWMHRHGRHMRQTLQRQVEAAGASMGAALAVGAITAMAVAREGAETVVFLYGLAATAEPFQMWLGAGVGLGLGVACVALVAGGIRHMPLRALFRLSEWLLLVTATSLLVAGLDRLVAMEWVPTWVDPLWDASGWIDDGQGWGRFLAEFAGYRARPAATVVLAVVLFWAFALWRLLRIDRAAR
ncbi:FTR1 family iron permease [Tepidimonas taiwanensis]|uniref:FTR1 family iron permease n=1 Tax=Tepidimonas taiwanensis TaxID=307486 RepID=UPI0005B884E7|nr:FTR1 family protein [Tepidimonas taiwanensis]